jgi:hypothetical protein
MDPSALMRLYYDQITRVIVIIVQLAAVILTCGFAWNFTQIILHAGIEGGSRIIPEVAFRVVGIVFGFLITANASKIVHSLSPIFLGKLF